MVIVMMKMRMALDETAKIKKHREKSAQVDEQVSLKPLQEEAVSCDTDGKTK